MTTSPNRMAHVVFRTNNLPALRDWWLTVLAADVVYEGRGICFMSYDEEHHRLVIINEGKSYAPNDGTQTGFVHVAYGFDTLDALADHYEGLAAHDVAPVRCINHGPTTSMYYADPDGNQVEFFVNNFPSKEECQAFMLSDAFAKNPIGTELGVDELVATIRGAGGIR